MGVISSAVFHLETDGSTLLKVLMLSN